MMMDNEDQTPEQTQPSGEATPPASEPLQAEEQASEEVVETTEIVDAPKKKRLASGREAAAAVSGSLGDFGGVAIHRFVHDDAPAKTP